MRLRRPASRLFSVPGHRAAASASALVLIASLTALGVTSAAAISPRATLQAAAKAVPVSPGLRGVVAAVPAASTPHVRPIRGGIRETQAQVRTIEPVGAQVVIGGMFKQLRQTTASTPVTRTSVAAYDKTTGTINAGFAPQLANVGAGIPEVNKVLAGPTAGTVYLAGHFDLVNGVAMKNLALVRLSNGALVNAFKPQAPNRTVNDLAITHGHLVVAGWFSKIGTASRFGIASLTPTTGALDGWMTVPFIDPHFPEPVPLSQNVGVSNIDVSSRDDRMIAIGNFRSAGGVARDSIAMVDLTTPTRASLRTNWATRGYFRGCTTILCSTKYSPRDVAFDPTGAFLVSVATRLVPNRDWDSVVRFETYATGSDIPETWHTQSKFDSFFSLAMTTDAVYVGGHFRWVNTQDMDANDNRGAVPRPGIAALDPANGTPLKWNPGRSPRGLGALALTVTSDGLYVGSDTEWIGNRQYRRGRIAFFPFAGGYVPPTTLTSSHLPADLNVAGTANRAPDLAWIARINRGNTNAGVRSQQIHPGDNFARVTSAWMVGKTLWTTRAGSTRLFKCTYNPATRTYSAWTAVDPYNDPYWSKISTGEGGGFIIPDDNTYRGLPALVLASALPIGGIYYDDGYLYFTYKGYKTFYRAAFSPDSGAIGRRTALTDLAAYNDISDLTAADGVLFFTRDSTGADIYTTTYNQTTHRVNWAGAKKLSGGRAGVNNSHGMWLAPLS